MTEPETPDTPASERVTPDTEVSTAPERVTADATPEPGASESPPRQKDSKKVAAGRAGAAARRTKQLRLLDELREAKAALGRQNSTPVARGHEVVAVPAVGTTKDLGHHSAVGEGPGTTDWNSLAMWVAGGLGFAGVVWLVRSRNGGDGVLKPAARAPGHPASGDRSATVSAGVRELKKRSDPFYME